MHQQELASLTHASGVGGGGFGLPGNGDNDELQRQGDAAGDEVVKSDTQLVQDVVDRALFDALDEGCEGVIPSDDLVAELREKGLLEQGDRRLTRAFRMLHTHGELDFEQFQAFLSKNLLVRRAFDGELVISDFLRFCRAIEEMWEASEPCVDRRRDRARRALPRGCAGLRLLICRLCSWSFFAALLSPQKPRRRQR